MKIIFAKESTRPAFEKLFQMEKALHEKLHPNILWFLLNHCQLVILIGNARFADMEVRFIPDFIFDGWRDKKGNLVDVDMLVMDREFFYSNLLLPRSIPVPEPEPPSTLSPYLASSW